MSRARPILKALVIMALVAVGAGFFHDNLNAYDGGLGVGFGLFLILGAWFLYRHWFGRTGQL